MRKVLILLFKHVAFAPPLLGVTFFSCYESITNESQVATNMVKLISPFMVKKES